LLERHLGVARLEEDLGLALGVERLAVVDVFEVHPGDRRDEDRRVLRLVGQRPDAVVAGPVLAAGRVVADDRREVAHGKSAAGHERTSAKEGNSPSGAVAGRENEVVSPGSAGALGSGIAEPALLSQIRRRRARGLRPARSKVSSCSSPTNTESNGYWRSCG